MDVPHAAVTALRKMHGIIFLKSACSFTLPFIHIHLQFNYSKMHFIVSIKHNQLSIQMLLNPPVLMNLCSIQSLQKSDRNVVATFKFREQHRFNAWIHSLSNETLDNNSIWRKHTAPDASAHSLCVCGHFESLEIKSLHAPIVCCWNFGINWFCLFIMHLAGWINRFLYTI